MQPHTQQRQLSEQMGRFAETLCMVYLRITGWHILKHRFTYHTGEIDLVAMRGKQLCFIEVKHRQSVTDAAYSISHSQQQRIRRTAEYFLQQYPDYQSYDCRFDVMLVGKWPFPKRIRNAWGW